ncbi:MAG: cupin domain-containing protein [Azospirillaceae bacterium]
MTSSGSEASKPDAAANGWHMTPAAARKALAQVPAPFVDRFRHGTLEVEFFAPRGVDTQQPHRRDEIYLVHAGCARFERAGEMVDVAPGDVLFVPAGMDHRFHAMSDDFETWVLFWGPEGGEAP